MTRQLDIDRILDGFLAEGTEELTDRVLEAALNDIDSTKQRRAWWPPRRFAEMNRYARLGIAAAAVIVVAVAGYNLLPGLGDVGTPGATLTKTPNPTARPVGGGSLDPGLYVIDNPARTPVGFTLTLPTGWSGGVAGLEISKEGDQPGSVVFTTTLVTHVYANACKSAGTLTEVGPTVDDLVGALEDQVDSDASAPEDVSVGGYPGKYITMSVPADLDTSTCTHPDLLIQVWADRAETDFFAIPVDPPGIESGVYIVDVHGKRVVILAGHAPGAAPADVAELEGILDSIKFLP